MTTSTPPSPTSTRPRRRSSQASGRNGLYTPSHSRHTSLSHRRKTSESSTRSIDGVLSPNGDLSGSIANGLGGGSSLDNLEAELAGAWEEEEEEDDNGGAASPRTPTRPNGSEVAHTSDHRTSSIPSSPSKRDNRTQENGTKLTLTMPNGQTTAPKKQRRRRDTRTTETLYDGSDYGESDSDSGGGDLTPELRMLIREVEELARQGSHMFLPPNPTSRPTTNGASPTKRRNPHFASATTSLSSNSLDAFGTFHRYLRDLGGQATLETLTSRLITAHASLATHLTHQTRTLQNAAFPLLSPLSLAAGTGPRMEDVHELLVLSEEALESLPQPSSTSLNSISYLHSTGKEAISALTGLSDSLHMSRQVEGTAARRLKSARECAGEIKKEYELEEIGRRWIENGKWEKKLKERDAMKVCREVTGGFEEVCEGWRKRLVDAAAAQGVAEVNA